MFLTLAKEPHYSDDLISLMHHFNTPKTRMRSPDLCSAPLLPDSSYYGCCNKRCQHNGHTKGAVHRDNLLKYLYDYGI